MRFHSRNFSAFVLFALVSGASAQGASAILESNIDRPLRYTPEGKDFVIINSAESFNRPLYTNTAFRVDGGDVPEFSMYLPGRGGNLRLGLQTAAGAKWLNNAARVVARYRAGSMVYEISDPLLGENGKLNLTVMTFPIGQGFIVRADTANAPAVTLLWAYGGANGQTGSRGGDIGTESQPVTRYFQLQPQYCANDAFALGTGSFTMSFRRQGANANTPPTVISGIAPPDSKLALADANFWNSPAQLLANAAPAPAQPVVVGQTPLPPGLPVYLALQRVPQAGETVPVNPTYQEITGSEPTTLAGVSAGPQLTYENLPQIFAAAEKRREDIANRVSVDTPDPFVNAAVSALCVAADGVWDDPQGIFMHGAVAWRSRYPGWRGDYIGDDLGFFDRAVRHFDYWAGTQNTDPVVAPSGPDPSANYARSEKSLHTNGIITNSGSSHYDMNLVFIDALMRHLLWTGDLDYARKMWPVIQRHLAWEQRLFRRPYGGDYLPLYEAYAAIWASDDLQYNGGGVTHTSAYNLFQNEIAAEIAKKIGEDPAPYEKEAGLIRLAMQRNLWLPERGWYAEAKDWLGEQRTHDSPAVWTFYHTVDSDAATPFEAWQMSRFVDTQIPHIPIRGPGVPEGYFTVSTTDWMPYTWSLNNVVMAEAAHTALAYWQSNRDNAAYQLYKGLILDSMYLGLCPGNAGMCTYYDANRRESQRDFGDGVGTLARATVEGLFGIRPDALAGEVTIRPGFPAKWEHASIKHPFIEYSYRADGIVPITTNTTLSDTAGPRSPSITRNITTTREGHGETYTVIPNFPKPMALRLQPIARYENVSSVTVNGQPVNWKIVEDAIETPRIEIQAPAAPRYDVRIVWEGAPLAAPAAPALVALGGDLKVTLPPEAHLLQVADPQGTINDIKATANALEAKATGLPGDRTFFVRLQQGGMNWWAPIAFEIRPAFEIIPNETQTAGSLSFALRNNTATAFDGNITVRAAGAAPLTTPAQIPALGGSLPVTLPVTTALPGANDVTVDLGQGRAVDGLVTNWKLTTDPQKGKLEAVNLSPYFNDLVTQIYRNEYLAPRSFFTSLATPTQGIGTWTNPTAAPPQIDDSGLRAAAAQSNGYFFLPQGVCFYTATQPGDKNIIYTSMWNNYPHAAEVPLTGKAAHAYLLMAGSTTAMQSRFDNGEIVVNYADGTSQRLVLDNPTNWWPIEQDYFVDDFAFRRDGPIPPRVSLRNGTARTPDLVDFKGTGGNRNSGGLATVLDLPLDPSKELKSLTFRPLANDIVVGLMAVTLARP